MLLFTNVTTQAGKDLYVTVDGAYIKSITSERPAGNFERIIDC